jgi:hypothetical protein
MVWPCERSASSRRSLTYFIRAAMQRGQSADLPRCGGLDGDTALEAHHFLTVLSRKALMRSVHNVLLPVLYGAVVDLSHTDKAQLTYGVPRWDRRTLIRA